ncbi:MAG: class I SAM-dependent methyltransferase [Chloroherpetonaceae bacterium]|nr:class I SAM-dependent methyltransferase [Chloroherpetonaceae bacterium]MDW8438223.1 methyltransferase domain-containing protein [Chloroherpetonaceae bacterium]
MRWANLPGLAKNALRHRVGKCAICGKRSLFLVFETREARHFRERLHCVFCKSVSRNRHVAKEILSVFGRKENSIQEAKPFLKTLKIYSASSGDALHRTLGDGNPNFVASEYFPDVPIGATKNGVSCQNLESLTFESEAFDLVITEDVLEHVADFEKAFSEIHRVLKRGGYHVFTVPLLLDAPTLERATLENGIVKHLLPPEYHGDPIRGEILAFRTFGYDIFERLAKFGFEAKLSQTFYQDTLRYAIADSHVIVSRKR